MTRQDMIEYETKQNAVGFKVGDRVKVVRIAHSREDGWDNTWNPLMDKYVGKKFDITFICSGSKGIHLDIGYNFPFFILERVESPEEKVKRVSEKIELLISSLKSAGCTESARKISIFYKEFLKTRKLSIEDVEFLNGMWRWALNAYAKNK